jgi:hypothetical protein
MDALCPIRKEKVQEVKNKILGKLYETKELKEETVNKLVRSEDLRNMICDFNLAKTHKPKSLSNISLVGKGTSRADLSIREEKVKEAKEKRKKGYYDNQEVFSKVAQRLLNLFGV